MNSASDEQVQFDQQAELVARATSLGINVKDHLCGCERCATTSELCPATLSSLSEEVARRKVPAAKIIDLFDALKRSLAK